MWCLQSSVSTNAANPKALTVPPWRFRRAQNDLVKRRWRRPGKAGGDRARRRFPGGIAVDQRCCRHAVRRIVRQAGASATVRALTGEVNPIRTFGRNLADAIRGLPELRLVSGHRARRDLSRGPCSSATVITRPWACPYASRSATA